MPTRREQVLAFYDIDDDGKVSAGELSETFKAWAATEKAIKAEKQTQNYKKLKWKWEYDSEKSEL